jgi:hypothetical protein
MQLNPLTIVLGAFTDQYVQAVESCGGTMDDVTALYGTWGTGNTAIATANRNRISGVSAGSTSHFASTQLNRGDGLTYVKHCPVQLDNPSAPANVAPVITGRNTVWWFNGQNPNPSAYPISITLTSSAGSTTSWSVTQNASLVTLSAQTGTQITVSSSGSSFSSQPGDVKIVASASGVSSQPFAITTRRPFRLVNPAVTRLCDASFGYETDISYEIQDQLFTGLPADVPYNEHFVTGAVQDNPQGNWASYGLPTQVGGIALSSPSGAVLIDEITGPGVSNNPPPNPLPVCVGDSTQQEHWGQEFGVGTQTPGGGVRVQTDRIVRFTNHAEHQNILSPPQ